MDHNYFEPETYFKRVYGDGTDWLLHRAMFVAPDDMYPSFGFGKAYAADEVVNDEVAIDLTKINPKTLPYKQKMLYYFKEFCYTTSSHGE
jgi:hypothetical protein